MTCPAAPSFPQCTCITPNHVHNGQGGTCVRTPPIITRVTTAPAQGGTVSVIGRYVSDALNVQVGSTIYNIVNHGTNDNGEYLTINAQPGFAAEDIRVLGSSYKVSNRATLN